MVEYYLMLSSKLTQRAYERARNLHAGQMRLGPKPIPFITHPVAVAQIVSSHVSDEEIVAAALLHDTLEDTKYTSEDIRDEFGERVAAIVIGQTIPEALEGIDINRNKNRERYYRALADAPAESLIVAATDKMHNFSCITELYGDDAEGFLTDFGGRPEDRIEIYGGLVLLIQTRIPAKLALELEVAWKAYKNLLERALRAAPVV